MSGIPDAFERANQETKRDIMSSREGVERWEGSPFEWMMGLPSRTKGKAGEVLVEHWLRNVGFSVDRPANSDHDRLVNNRKVEIKFSTLWAQDSFTFQQLRDQDYEFVFLLGLSPHKAEGWFIPKQVVFDKAIPQHGGSAGSDTKWLTFPADNAPGWLSEYGGDLDACRDSVERHVG